MKEWQLIWTSERSILARLPESVAQSDAASQLAAWIHSYNSHLVRSVVPSAKGVLIEFDILHCSLGQAWSVVEQIMVSFECDQCSSQSKRTSNAQEILIPVCYDKLLAPDLLQVAHQLNCNPDRIIELHTSIVYRVDAMGFMPGFGYLGSLHNFLHMPRMVKPRR